MTKLLRAVPLGTTETPASFVSRLAGNHGLSARDFALDWNVNFQHVVDGKPEAIAKIADLGGVSADDLAVHAFVRKANLTYDYRGQTIVRKALRRSRIHVCPACVREDLDCAPDVLPAARPYNRSLWLIEALKTCPAHGMALVRIADDLSPGTLHDFSYHIAAALPRLGTLLSEAQRRHPSAFERYILDRCSGAQCSSFLDGFPLYAAIKACELIGAVATLGRTPNLKALSEDEWWRAGGAGFEIAAGGAQRIHDLLAELQRTYPYSRSATEGPQAFFGRLYQVLAFGLVDPVYDKLRDVLAEYITAHLPVGPGDEVFGKPVTVRKLHSIATLSRETGAHPKRALKALRASGTVGDDQMGLSAGNVLVPAQTALQVVMRDRTGTLSFPQAREHLNAPRVQADLLVKHGFIKPHLDGRPFRAADRYAVADLDDFLGRLFRNAVDIRKPKATQVDIPSAAKRACCSAAEIVQLVLDGKLNWIGRLTDERGYMGVLVDLEEIRRKTRGADPGGVTRRPASKILRVGDKIVDALIADGRLKTFVAPDPVSRVPQEYVAHSELERFARDYISLFQLAEQREQHFSRVLKDLNSRGIEPAFDTDKIGARFYARSAVSD